MYNMFMEWLILIGTCKVIRYFRVALKGGLKVNNVAVFSQTIDPSRKCLIQSKEKERVLLRTPSSLFSSSLAHSSLSYKVALGQSHSLNSMHAALVAQQPSSSKVARTATLCKTEYEYCLYAVKRLLYIVTKRPFQFTLCNFVCNYLQSNY